VDLRSEQAKLLVSVGVGHAVDVIDRLLQRIAMLCTRCADEHRFVEVEDKAEWGQALTHAIDEIRAAEKLDLDGMARYIDAAAEVAEVTPPWLYELQLEITRLRDGQGIPPDRDPFRLRAGLVLATQEIARLQCVANREETGEDWDDEIIRLGGADGMREIMARVDRGETGV